MKNSKKKSDAAILRRKAEELIKNKPLSASSFSKDDMLKLLHELEVNRIELELLNDELIRAKEEAETATEKYIELYDFSVSGYVTLSAACKIEMINLTGARMLGKERSRLIGNNFSYFISHDTQPVFDDFFGKVFNRKINEECQVTITIDGNTLLYLNIKGIRSKKGDQCYLTLLDISDRAHAADIKKRSEELETLNNSYVVQEHKLI
jgi:nitrogen fixation/metabolism regulation signal transduction histidine kinase